MEGDRCVAKERAIGKCRHTVRNHGELSIVYTVSSSNHCFDDGAAT